jgi:hypothetical protein
VLDQFGAPVVPQPAVFWRTGGAGGFVTESGLFTAGNQPGNDFYVYARSTGLFGDTTQITIVP